MQLNYSTQSVGDAFCVASFYAAINQAAESRGCIATRCRGTPREMRPPSRGKAVSFPKYLM